MKQNKVEPTVRRHFDPVEYKQRKRGKGEKMGQVHIRNEDTPPFMDLMFSLHELIKEQTL